MTPAPPRPSPTALMPHDIEDDLRAYLRKQRDTDVAGKLEQLFVAYMEHDKKDVQRHEELVGIIRGHSLRIGELEKDAGTFEAELANTGKIQLIELKEKNQWRDRLVVTVLIGVFVSAFSGGIGVLITYLVSRK